VKHTSLVLQTRRDTNPVTPRSNFAYLLLICLIDNIYLSFGNDRDPLFESARKKPSIAVIVNVSLNNNDGTASIMEGTIRAQV
jgi:hypothetical protein